MRLLFLVTDYPSWQHAKAVKTVAAELIEALLGLGHQVAWAIAGSDPPDQASLDRLAASGAVFLGDVTSEMEFLPQGAWAHRLELVRNCLPGLGRDWPRFRDPAALAARLQRDSGAEAAILFWDSWFEHLLPAFSIPVVGYWARPRYASALDGVLTGLSGPANPLARRMVVRSLHGARRRNLERGRQMARLTNICAVDAAEYRAAGVPCTYVSNTWLDPVGDAWRQRRVAAEARQPGTVILGGMGSAVAAGTLQGIRFWSTEVLPRLEQAIGDLDWTVTICGRRTDELPADVRARLSGPRVVIKGFVEDIDEEMLSSHVFLMCNNAGTYSGGYTRVIYAMSTGACMVAHRRIVDSMPEVRHGENALLGETAEEITALTVQAVRDPDLRRRIGEGARATYEAEYHPRAVAAKLAALAAEACR